MRAKKKNKFYLWFFCFAALLGLGFFINNLQILEKNPPEILAQNVLYSNLKTPLKLEFKDDSGIKNVKIKIRKSIDDDGLILLEKNFNGEQNLSLDLTLPKPGFREKIQFYLMDVEVEDKSLWKLGNKAFKQIQILIDEQRPKVSVLANSYQIDRGGAAAVVFSVDDENLDEFYIETNKGRIFHALPYIKEGFYASLVAWDARDEDFRAYIIAKDKAGNMAKENIRYYLSNRKYKSSKIQLSDYFLDGKIKSLSEQFSEENLDRFENFKFINENLRAQNENLIDEITSKPLENELLSFKIHPFLPLKNGAKVAEFADHRFYHYKENFISESYHLGLDLASIARANIIASNAGQVVFAEENGIYGANLVIYHGFGLYTLYGHCSSLEVNLNDQISRGDVIAKTGTSGLALGDHLHFETIIQGVKTRPEEWQDKKWIENNIYKILDDGKKIILRNTK